MQEFETKVLEINRNQIHEKLIALGAVEFEERLFRRWIYEIDEKAMSWIRLRDEGHKITLTYKNKRGEKTSDPIEIEVEVDNFEETNLILQEIEFKKTYYQESKRKLYKLNDIEFAIDTWPKIPTYLEIESSSPEKVQEGLKLLELEGKEIGNYNVNAMFKDFYNIDLHSFKEFKF